MIVPKFRKPFPISTIIYPLDIESIPFEVYDLAYDRDIGLWIEILLPLREYEDGVYRPVSESR
jgi:hypothetical protein